MRRRLTIHVQWALYAPPLLSENHKIHHSLLGVDRLLPLRPVYLSPSLPGGTHAATPPPCKSKKEEQQRVAPLLKGVGGCLVRGVTLVKLMRHRSSEVVYSQNYQALTKKPSPVNLTGMNRPAPQTTSTTGFSSLGQDELKT